MKYIIPSRSKELEEEEEQGEESYSDDVRQSFISIRIFDNLRGVQSNNDSEPPNENSVYAGMTTPPPPLSSPAAEQAAPSLPVRAPDALTHPPDNLQTVSTFLSHRTESGMSGREVEQLLTTIQKCTPRKF